MTPLQSQYVPESHYLLALTFEQLNQDEESIKELLVLLRGGHTLIRNSFLISKVRGLRGS